MHEMILSSHINAASWSNLVVFLLVWSSSVHLLSYSHTITVSLGDELILMCPNGSFSNLISLVSKITSSSSEIFFCIATGCISLFLALLYFGILLQETPDQFNSCNSSGTVMDTKSTFRGFCYGEEYPLRLNIEEPSARLPSDLSFQEGVTTYLTSKYFMY